MQAAPAMALRPLPGTSVSRMQMGLAIFYSAVTLVVSAFLSLVDTTWLAFLTRANSISNPPVHWHLPWPVLQWAVDSPVGYLALLALGIVVVAPLLVLFGTWRYRREIARARDITDVPQVGWSTLERARPQPPLLQRWLGLRRHEQAVSLVLLVLGMLLAVALVAVFCAVVVVSSRLSLENGQGCNISYGCPPLTDTLRGIPIVSLWAVMALVFSPWVVLWAAAWLLGYLAAIPMAPGITSLPPLVYVDLGYLHQMERCTTR